MKGLRVAVVGLGVQGGGIGTVMYLLAQGARVTISDRASRDTLKIAITEIEKKYRSLKRRTPATTIFAPVYRLGGAHNKRDVVRAQLVVINPDVPRTSPVFKWARLYKVSVRIGDTALFMERCPAPIIGLTGTRGKTTTALLTGHILHAMNPKTVVAGNLRVSPLNILSRLEKSKQMPPVVLELSSWQLEGLLDIRVSPHIAMVTNITPDHLNRYRSFSAYKKAKSLILRYQTPQDHALLSRDNPSTRSLAKDVRSTLWWVSARKLPSKQYGAFFDSGWLMIRTPSQLIRVLRRSDSPLIGAHQQTNIAFAALGAWLSGVGPTTIRAAVRTFTGVKGRLEIVRTHEGVTFINDTAATSPEAVIAALSACAKNSSTIVLIAGGADKDLDFSDMVTAIQRSARALILLPGTASKKIVALMKKRKSTVQTHHVASMNEALERALRIAKQGDTVLLSPGAASFGLFRNAYERGDQFREFVRAL